VITCDLCQAEDAELMYSTFSDGSTIAVGPMCAPLFVTGLAIALGVLPDPDAAPESAAEPKRSRRKQVAAPEPETAAQSVPEPVEDLGEPV